MLCSLHDEALSCRICDSYNTWLQLINALTFPSRRVVAEKPKREGQYFLTSLEENRWLDEKASARLLIDFIRQTSL